jgi:hypothetical protein
VLTSLAISAISLAALRRFLRLALAILSERTPDVVAFVEFSLVVTADVALVAARIN